MAVEDQRGRHRRPRSRKTLYRARIGGFASRADAERLCLALLSKGRDCKVV